jgi:hypothetical protein
MEITVRSEKSFALHDPVKSAYVYAIQLYYLSIMLFPDDALRRTQMLAVFGARWKENVDEVKSKHLTFLTKVAKVPYKDILLYSAIAKEVGGIAYERLFKKNGGYKALSESEPFSKILAFAKKTAKDWGIIGEIVRVIMALDFYHSDVIKGGASLKKAYYILVHSPVYQGKFHINNEKCLEKLWGKYRGVAHLCASHLFCSPLFEIAYPKVFQRFFDDSPHTREHLDQFLSGALSYQNWLTTYCPHGSKGKPLVDSEDLFGITDTGLLVLEGRQLTAPLDNETLSSLRSYAAPTPAN